jgi:hypothetical protein
MRYQSANQISGNKGIILTLIGIGLVLGLALIKSDLANPIKGVADFRRAEVETNRVAQQNEVDLRQYEALQEARTQAEIEGLREEIQYLRQTHEQDLRQMEEETRYLHLAHEQNLRYAQEQAALRMQQLRLLGYTGITALGLALISLSVGFSVYIARRRPAFAKVSADVWTTERKRRAIAAARRRERESRQQGLEFQERLRELFSTPVGSNGHEDPDELFAEPLSPLQVYD